MKQPSDWKSLERHPLSAEYVDLSGSEWVRFVAGMREKRFSPAHPIILFEGKVLDGWQRQRACVMTFVTPVYAEYEGDDPAGFVEQENDNRRHETPLQKDQRIEARDKAIVAARAEGQSLRVIAEKENVSKDTVARVIQSTVSCETVEPPEGKITGKDGRQRPAKVTRKPAEPKRCDRCLRQNRPDKGDCPQCETLQRAALKKEPASASQPKRSAKAQSSAAEQVPSAKPCPHCHGTGQVPVKATPKGFHKPTVEEVRAYCEERSNKIDPDQFVDHYESNGWRVGKTSMKDWQAAVRTWEKNDMEGKHGKPELHVGLKAFLEGKE